jgi:hypothetical protein
MKLLNTETPITRNFIPPILLNVQDVYFHKVGYTSYDEGIFEPRQSITWIASVCHCVCWTSATWIVSIFSYNIHFNASLAASFTEVSRLKFCKKFLLSHRGLSFAHVILTELINLIILFTSTNYENAQLNWTKRGNKTTIASVRNNGFLVLKPSSTFSFKLETSFTSYVRRCRTRDL